MISLSDSATSLLTGSYKYFCRIESWLDGELLSDDVPITSGVEESDRTLQVPERITLAVPRIVNGVDWTPTAVDHPLAANGQRLRVLLGIGLANGVVEWFQRGEFLLVDSVRDGDSITVTGLGLLQLVAEARLVSPYQPSGTIGGTIRGLIEPALTVVIDAALTDRAVPSGINFDEDRLGAVHELLDAWPAEAHVTPYGYLQVSPIATPTTAVLSLTDAGETATVVDTAGVSTREGAVSAVVARGTASDGGQVQGVAYDLTTGPHRYGGPFNPLPVPEYFASPLLTTVTECVLAANTIMARRRRETQLKHELSAVPRPDLELSDVIDATLNGTDTALCTVEAMRLPYTPSGGEMTLTLREVT